MDSRLRGKMRPVGIAFLHIPLDPQSSIQSFWRLKAPILHWNGAGTLLLSVLTTSTIQPSSGQLLRSAWFFPTAGQTSQHLRHCGHCMLLFSGLKRRPLSLLAQSVFPYKPSYRWPRVKTQGCDTWGKEQTVVKEEERQVSKDPPTNIFYIPQCMCLVIRAI